MTQAARTVAPTKWVDACAVDELDERDVMSWDHGGRTYAIYHSPDGEFFCTGQARPRLREPHHLSRAGEGGTGAGRDGLTGMPAFRRTTRPCDRMRPFGNGKPPHHQATRSWSPKSRGAT